MANRHRLLVLFLMVSLGCFGGARISGTEPDPAALARAAEKELYENILPFWLEHARNPATGGFHAVIGEDMSVHDDQPRGSLLTSRILWTFSAAYRSRPDPQYLEMARYAWRDLTSHFLDREHGGVYWSIHPDGTPDDARKQIYAQAFALYALTEFHRATGEASALSEARRIFELIESHAHDPRHGGYFDVLDRSWQRMGEDMNILGAAAKSQNSHIHILEAYTNLLRVWPDPTLRQRHGELVQLMLGRIIDPQTHHLVLFMDDNWTPRGHEVSYGHDIELSWLLVEAAEVAANPALLTRARSEALRMADVTLAEGIDRDGGVYLEGEPGGPTKFEKEWWEQAESLVGFANAYQISGDARYLRQAKQSWQFIQERVVDRQHGDWHNTLNRDGTLIREQRLRNGRVVPMAKLSTWKCPYHNSRACLQLIERFGSAESPKPQSP